MTGNYIKKESLSAAGKPRALMSEIKRCSDSISSENLSSCEQFYRWLTAKWTFEILGWKVAAWISVFIQNKMLQHQHQQNSKWSESAYYLEKWYACPVKVLIWHIYNKLFNDEQWSVVNKLIRSWYFRLLCHELSNKLMCWRSRKRKKSLREQKLQTSDL